MLQSLFDQLKRNLTTFQNCSVKLVVVDSVPVDRSKLPEFMAAETVTQLVSGVQTKAIHLPPGFFGGETACI